MAARYRFLPWVRLGAAPSLPDTLGAGMPTRATIPVQLRLNGRDDIGVTARLHGPGDVVSIDTRMVVRTDPPHLASEFEPNYFPLVEFDRPDIPWLFTPAAGAAAGRLRPWIVLVTVRRQPGVTVAVDPGSRRPVLRIEAPASPRVELPDLADSWAWAHAQVVDPDTGVGLAELLAADSTQNLSRLVCPRRLHAGHVVRVVRRAGVRGRPAERARAADHGRPTTPSCGRRGGAVARAPPSIDLPVLYHFEFSTGDAGDFESLALRLHPSPAPEGLGVRPMDVTGLGFGIPDLGNAPLGGALRPIDVTPRGPLPPAFADALQEVLDLPAARADGGSVDPVVGPPVYGGRQAAQPAVSGAPPWLRTVNLDPRLRAAAGLGAMVVQDQQEHLMAAAWDQLGRAATATRELRQPVFAASRARTGPRSGSRRSTPTRCSPSPARRSPGWRCRRRTACRAGCDRHDAGPPADDDADAVDGRVRCLPQGGAPAGPARPAGPGRRPGWSVRSGGPSDDALRRRHRDARPGHLLAGPRADMVTPAIVTAQFDGLIVPSLPERIEQSIALREAFVELRAYYERVAGVPPRTETRPPLVAAAFHSQLLLQLDPVRTVAPAVPPPVAAPVGPDGTTSEPPTPTDAAAELPGPVFGRPMYEPLRDLDPQFLLPGCDRVLADTVVPLASDAVVHRGVHDRAQPRDEPRAPLAGVPERRAQHVVPRLLAAGRLRSARVRPAPAAARVVAGQRRSARTS